MQVAALDEFARAIVRNRITRRTGSGSMKSGGGNRIHLSGIFDNEFRSGDFAQKVSIAGRCDWQIDSDPGPTRADRIVDGYQPASTKMSVLAKLTAHRETATRRSCQTRRPSRRLTPAPTTSQRNVSVNAILSRRPMVPDAPVSSTGLSGMTKLFPSVVSGLRPAGRLPRRASLCQSKSYIIMS
jgi:hypothetical protein